MKTRDKQLGQTLIETTFILALILLILFGIAEFARAWFLKNSLNNAARIGARVAVVQSNLNETAGIGPKCGTGGLSPDVQAVLDSVCDSGGVDASDRNVYVDIDIDDEDGSGDTSDGDIITVTVLARFLDSGGSEGAQFSVFSSFIPGLSGGLDSLSSRASMRYEL
jgi:Flp pilus assembly protein TadG